MLVYLFCIEVVVHVYHGVVEGGHHVKQGPPHPVYQRLLLERNIVLPLLFLKRYIVPLQNLIILIYLELPPFCLDLLESP